MLSCSRSMRATFCVRKTTGSGPMVPRPTCSTQVERAGSPVQRLGSLINKKSIAKKDFYISPRRNIWAHGVARLTRLPVTEKIRGSNPLGPASRQRSEVSLPAPHLTRSGIVRGHGEDHPAQRGWARHAQCGASRSSASRHSTFSFTSCSAALPCGVFWRAVW